jgi:serine/threonine protein kinase
LGNGSFGKVYKCEYTDEKGNVYSAACKKSKSTKEAEELFNKEMSAVRKLDHLFIVKYFNIVEKDFKKYF